MPLLIEKTEAMQLLRANVKHYLWRKTMSAWSEEDVYNLRHGINKNLNNTLGEKPIYSGKPITATRSNDIFKFDSVAKASDALGVPSANIYALLNGRNARNYGYTFKKINP